MTSATATKPTLKDMRQWVETIHAEIYSVWHTAKDKMTASELNHLEGALRIISELLTILEASSVKEGEALARVRAKVAKRDEEWIGRDWVLAEIDAATKAKRERKE